MSKGKAIALTVLAVLGIMVVIAAGTTALGGILAPVGLEWLARGINLGAAIWLGFFGIERIYGGIRG